MKVGAFPIFDWHLFKFSQILKLELIEYSFKKSLIKSGPLRGR